MIENCFSKNNFFLSNKIYMKLEMIEINKIRHLGHSVCQQFKDHQYPAET